MNYGFENGKFYVDITPCSRPHGNMREETDRKTRELAETGSKFILSFSGGVDSQSVLHSFHTQNIPLETAFLYLPGYNDNEYEQVQIIDKKYGRKTWVIDIDPISCKDEIIKVSEELDISAKNNVMQRKFLSMLPDGYDFIQMAHDPYVNKYNDIVYYVQSYYLPEISRQRALDSLNRTGKNIFYGDSSEFLMSIIDDDVFKAAVSTMQYFDGNGLEKDRTYLKSVDRWDYYIKPLIYGKYWKDELIYFPKYAGFEKVEYLYGNEKLTQKQHMVGIEYHKLLEWCNKIGGKTHRFYENVPSTTFVEKE